LILLRLSREMRMLALDRIYRKDRMEMQENAHSPEWHWSDADFVWREFDPKVETSVCLAGKARIDRFY